MPQLIELGPQYGTMEFPDEYTPEQIEREIQARFAPRSGFARRYIADPLLELASGAVSVPEAAIGVLDIPSLGIPGRALEAVGVRPKAWREYITSGLSPEAREARARVQAAEGLWPKVRAAVSEPSVVLGTTIESLPSMVGGAIAGRALLGVGGAAARIAAAERAAAQAGARFAEPAAATAERIARIGTAARAAEVERAIRGAAVGEGLVSAGLTAEQIRQESESGFLTPKQAALALTTGIGTTAIGYWGGRLAGRLGLEDPDVWATAGRMTTGGKRDLATRVIGGAVSEGLFQEFPQSVLEQVQQNWATGKRWDEGVTDNAVLGGLSGALLGGMANLRARREGGPSADRERESGGVAAVQPAGAVPGVAPEVRPQRQGAARIVAARPEAAAEAAPLISRDEAEATGPEATNAIMTNYGVERDRAVNMQARARRVYGISREVAPTPPPTPAAVTPAAAPAPAAAVALAPERRAQILTETASAFDSFFQRTKNIPDKGKTVPRFVARYGLSEADAGQIFDEAVTGLRQRQLAAGVPISRAAIPPPGSPFERIPGFDRLSRTVQAKLRQPGSIFSEAEQLEVNAELGEESPFWGAAAERAAEAALPTRPPPPLPPRAAAAPPPVPAPAVTPAQPAPPPVPTEEELFGPAEAPPLPAAEVRRAEPPPPAPTPPPPGLLVRRVPRGRVVRTVTPVEGGAIVDVVYELMEMRDLKPKVVLSISDVQTRQRAGSQSSENQINTIANNPEMQKIGESGVSHVGAPVVDDVVLVGHGRSEGLIRGYEANTPGIQRYRQELVNEVAPRLGLDASGFEQPILVRRLRSYIRGNRRSFIEESNQAPLLADTVAEQPLNDAAALGDLSALRFDDEGNLTRQSALEAQTLLKAANRGVIETPGGGFNAAILNQRVKYAVLAWLADRENVSFAELTQILVSPDGAKHINELIRFATGMVGLDADLSIVAPWIRALRELQIGIRAVNNPATGYESLQQWNRDRKLELALPLDPMSPEAEFLLDRIVEREKKPASIREPINRYITYAHEEQNKREAARVPEIPGIPRPAFTPTTARALLPRAFAEGQIPPPAAPGAGVPEALREEPEEEPEAAAPPTPAAPRRAKIDIETVQIRPDQEFTFLAAAKGFWTSYSAKTKRRSASTLRATKRWINFMLNDVPEFSSLNLKTATQEQFEAVISGYFDPVFEKADELKKDLGLLDKTRVVRQVMDFAFRKWALTNLNANAWSKEELKYTRWKALPYYLPSGQQMARLREEFARLIGDTYRSALDVFDVLWTTGLRIGSAMMLRWSDIDFTRREIAVRFYKTRRGGERAQVERRPLTQQAFEALSRMRNERPNESLNEYVLKGDLLEPQLEEDGVTRKYSELAAKPFRNYLKQAARAAGLSLKNAAGETVSRGFTLHWFRAVWQNFVQASLEQAGYPPSQIGEIISYLRITTSRDDLALPGAAQRYAAPRPELVRDALTKIRFDINPQAPPGAPPQPPGPGAPPPPPGPAPGAGPAAPAAPGGPAAPPAGPQPAPPGPGTPAGSPPGAAPAAQLWQQLGLDQALMQSLGFDAFGMADSPTNEDIEKAVNYFLTRSGKSLNLFPTAVRQRIIAGVARALMSVPNPTVFTLIKMVELPEFVKALKAQNILPGNWPEGPQPLGLGPSPALPPPGSYARPLGPDEGSTPEQIQARIAAEVREQDRAGFPIALLNRIQAAPLIGANSAQTWYGFEDKGTLYLIPENIPNSGPIGTFANLGELVRHEAAHALISAAGGIEAVGQSIGSALNLTPEQLKMVLGFDASQRGYGLTGQQVADLRAAGWSEQQIQAAVQWRAYDEFFAIARERNQSVWRRIVEAVKVWLAQNFGLQLSNEETARAILRAIETNLSRVRRQENADFGRGLIREPSFQISSIPPRAAIPSPDTADAPKTINIAGNTYQVMSKDQITQADKQAGRAAVVSFMQTLGELGHAFPGQPDTSPRGVIGPRAGNKDPNYTWIVTEDGFPHDAEVRDILIPEIKRAVVNKDQSYPDAAYAAELINMVHHNFNEVPNNFGQVGSWENVISPETLAALMEVTTAESSYRGTSLQLLTGVALNPESIARHPDFHLHRAQYDVFPGEAIRDLVASMLKYFRTYFTDEELSKYANLPGNAANVANLQALFAKLMALNRQEEGGRVYRIWKRLFKAKQAKRLATLEAEDRAKEAVRRIVETLKGAGKEPIPPVPSGRTALDALLLHISEATKKGQPNEREKIRIAIEQAVQDGRRDAGVTFALSQITDKDERAQAREDFDNKTREPTEDEIKAGLALPEFAFVQIFIDNFLGYDPVTVKLAEDVVSQYFKGAQRTGLYGQARPERPEDLRQFNLNQLAKEPGAEIDRVFNQVLALIRERMSLQIPENASEKVRAQALEDQRRIAFTIAQQFEAQLRLAQDRFIDNFLKPPEARPAPTPQERMNQLINANLAARQPLWFNGLPIQDLLRKIAQRFDNAENMNHVAGDLTVEGKERWIRARTAEIIQDSGVAREDPNSAFRIFAEQVVMNDLSTRLQAAELRIVERILGQRDVTFPGPMTFAEVAKQQEKIVDQLERKSDQLRKGVNAGLLDRIESAVNKSVVQQSIPSLNQMIRQAMTTPPTKHGDIARNFAEALVRDLGVDEGYVDDLMKLVEAAYGKKFAAARQMALAQAVNRLDPALRRPFRRRQTWETVVQVVNSGGMETNTILDALARRQGWKPLTDEVRARFRDMVTRMDKLRNLDQQLREKAAAEWYELTPDEQAEYGSVDRYIEGYATERYAALRNEETGIKKQIETLWARMTAPVNLRTREGIRNLQEAAAEMSAANLLLRTSFPFRQLFDIITQGFIHAPTRAIAAALQLYQLEKNPTPTFPGEAVQSRPTHFWQDASAALKASYTQRIAHWRETIATTIATFKGTPDARNVERLESGIAAFDRADQYADELEDKGRHMQAFAYRLLTVMRWGFRIAAAFDAVHGVPAEFQEMWLDAYNHLVTYNIPRSVARLEADRVMGIARDEWAHALVAAKKHRENAGLSIAPGDVRAAAANVVKARAYAKMGLLGMPADDFLESAEAMRNAIGWNLREEGGLGGALASTFQYLRSWSHNLPPPLSFMAALFNFGNAIGTSINRALSFTPFGFFPATFGVRKRDIDISGVARRGSPWFRTERDRFQRSVEATIGTSVGSTLFALAAMGLIKVRTKWPEDKEERELWQQGGHSPGTVEFWSDDGKSFIPFSLTTGPFAVVRPWLAAGGALNDLLENRAKAQAKLNEEAARRGLTPGTIAPLSLGDTIGVAGQAAWSTLFGGRTAAGLVGTLSSASYGIPNTKQAVAGAIAPYVPGLPALQEVSRMAGVRMDPKLASVMDFLVPLPTSQAAQVNMVGDRVGTQDDAQRVVQILTGGTYPATISSKERESLPAYKTLFETGYRPPSISSTQAYQIGNDYRPLSNNELSKYTRLRGEYFKQELMALPEGASKEQAQAAFQTANQRALSAVGAQRTARTGAGGGGGAIRSVLAGAGGQAPALGGGAGGRLGGVGGGLGGGGRVRSSLARGRTLRLRRLRAPRLRRTRLALGGRRRRRISTRTPRRRYYA